MSPKTSTIHISIDHWTKPARKMMLIVLVIISHAAAGGCAEVVSSQRCHMVVDGARVQVRLERRDRSSVTGRREVFVARTLPSNCEVFTVGTSLQDRGDNVWLPTNVATDARIVDLCAHIEGHRKTCYLLAISHEQLWLAWGNRSGCNQVPNNSPLAFPPSHMLRAATGVSIAGDDDLPCNVSCLVLVRVDMKQVVDCLTVSTANMPRTIDEALNYVQQCNKNP